MLLVLMSDNPLYVLNYDIIRDGDLFTKEKVTHSLCAVCVQTGDIDQGYKKR